jgi:hypothetical protein
LSMNRHSSVSARADLQAMVTSTRCCVFCAPMRTCASSSSFGGPFYPTQKDDFILELAVGSRAYFLVTFNSRDFAGAERFGVRVISPREFLAIIGDAP